MRRWRTTSVVGAAFVTTAAALLAATPQAGLAQATNPMAPSAAGIPEPTNLSPDVSPAANPANPQAPGAASPDASNPANYGSTPSNYTSTRAPTSTSEISPAAVAAQQQSGLDQTQAASLLQQKGYSQVEVHPDPNSLWVWQADATKDGRSVQVGIDYRGNVVETSSTQSRPCTGPGVSLGVNSGLGAGSALQQADSCR
jgi:hypothetical protein